MNPPCARCKKTVYPTEKLACLDKYWHKGCFNCEVCSMTLSMKTYKGYQKLPYCNTHYPKTKFTPVAETPENMRLKKNTENQSSVIYHKEFEQDKGKLTTVADDPESLRLAKTQKQASDLSYQNKIKSQASIDRAPQEEAPQAQHSQHSQQQAPQYHVQPAKQQGFPQPPAPVEVAPVKAPVAAPAPAPPAASVGHKYVALYDYTAADDDEVTFVEGDYITNGEIIDDGWMTGTVERTGENGMLPSNYVEAC